MKKSSIYEVTLTAEQAFLTHIHEATEKFLNSKPDKSDDFKAGFRVASEGFSAAFLDYKRLQK